MALCHANSGDRMGALIVDDEMEHMQHLMGNIGPACRNADRGEFRHDIGFDLLRGGNVGGGSRRV